MLTFKQKNKKKHQLLANLIQLSYLPKSLIIAKKLTDKAFTTRTMDRAIFDFYGALGLELTDSELRVWPNIEGGFASVTPDQIVRTPLKVWRQMILFAAETEAPINNYSTASAEVLRAFIPSLSAYMGRTIEEEIAFLEMKKNSQEFCDTVWCREESRHGPTLVAVATKISGTPVAQNMTYEAEAAGDFSSPSDVYNHIIARNGSEWHANGLYLYLQSHSTGATAKWLNNVCNDETRHLTVFSAAYSYLYGPRFFKRIKDMLKSSMQFRSSHKKQNSHGDSIIMALNTSVILELLAIHFLIELKIRRYLKSIPLMTLKKIFEVQPKDSKRPQGFIPQVKSKEIEEVKRKELKAREKLDNWPKRMKRKKARQKRYKLENAIEIKRILVEEFNLFTPPIKPREFKLKLKALKLSTKLNFHITEYYRDYVIMSQGLESSSKELMVEFDSVQTGFIVRTLKNKKGQEYACFCKGVTRVQILEQVKNGVTKIEEIQKNTQASTGCGKCTPTIQALLTSSKKN